MQEVCDAVLLLHPILYPIRHRAFKVTSLESVLCVCGRDSPPQCGSSTIGRFVPRLETAAELSLQDLLKTGSLWRH